MKEEDYLQLSGIQHFAFCRRQWVLIHVEGVWEENELTTEGRKMYERAHDRNLVSKRGDIIEIRDLPIKSDTLGISGSCDVVELIPDETGVGFPHIKGTFRIRPVEYKHGRPKKNDADRMQLVASW